MAPLTAVSSGLVPQMACTGCALLSSSHFSTGTPTPTAAPAHLHWHARHQTQARPRARPRSRSSSSSSSSSSCGFSSSDVVVVVGRRHQHTWPTSAHPTPYEVLGHARGRPYSKAHFYELVKTYHPDTSSVTAAAPNGLGLSPAQMLERYRLVVAAHAVLSDPRKRRAYDDFGVGWAVAPDGAGHPRRSTRAAGRSWGATGSAAHNGTWEDWERWRASDGAGWGGTGTGNGDDATANGMGRQRPIFMANSTFAYLLVVLGVAASWVQAVRARNAMAEAAAQHQRAHRQASVDLLHSRFDSQALTREGRLSRFRAHRDGVWTV